MIIEKCATCGTFFSAFPSDNKKYCSRQCYEIGSSWKGGKFISKEGYEMALLPGKGTYTTAQRVLMSSSLKRELRRGEVVHHVDGNKLNNDPANLIVCTRAAHARLHSQLRQEASA